MDSGTSRGAGEKWWIWELFWREAAQKGGLLLWNVAETQGVIISIVICTFLLVQRAG